jgi:hypothetical protein
MADKNQLKIADQVDLADDDPFAELTRIMGFDPRQPARQAQQKQAPAPEPAPIEQAAEEDDFSLDLEKELLGEFAFEDDAPAAEAAAPAEIPAAEAASAEVPDVDFDFSADFDAAMAASDEPELAAEPEAEFDLGLTDDDVRALDAEASQPAVPEQAEEEDFDLGLSVDDVSVLDAEASQPTAPAEAAPVVDAAAGGNIDAEFDAAMADIDMDFGDAFASEPVAVAPAEEGVEAAQDEAAGVADGDLHLFDEADFRLEDEVADEPAAAVEPEPQPELDESAFDFGEEELRLDDEHPVDAPVEEEAIESAADVSFDDVDFAAEDFSAEPEIMEPETTELEAVEAEAAAPEPVAEEPEVAATASDPTQAEPGFELPRYEPRKLPISPMDVAAEEYRQREAAHHAPAEPEFNLEDELNALLGNLRSGQAAAAQAPAPVAPIAEAPKVEQPAVSYEASRPAAYEPPTFRVEQPSFAPEPISFDPPAHPADIEDNLSWDLDDAFAAEASEPAEEGQPEVYAEDGEQYDAYAEAEQPEETYEAAQPEVYAQGSDDELASLDFDDLSFEPEAEEQPSTPYGYAAAGAAAGAASRFGSALASRPFETGSTRLSDLPRAPVGERFAEHPQAASADETFSPHRDPVVRGNPLKEDPLDIITQLAEKYSQKEPVTPYGRAMGVARGSTSTPFAGVAEDEDIDISAAFEDQPDVETVEVSDQAVALADDLDIPELPEEEELPPVSAYDDLDAEFSDLLSDMNAEPRPVQPGSGQAGAYAGFEARPYENQAAASTVGSRQAPASRATYDDDPEPDSFALDTDDLPGSRPVGQYPTGQYAAHDYDYDPDMDQEIAPQHFADGNGRQTRSRGLLLAGLVGGVALIGAIGAFAFSFGGGSNGDTPALVRADEGPVKVKPENPGGTTVPNQDNKVYETVAGEGAAGTPQQEKLVTTAEEPVDVTPPPPAMVEETTAAPSGKSEDRIEQIVQEAENQTDDELVAVTPRKVRTMVVKPDGTLVEREDEPGAAPSGEQTETIAAAVPEAGPAPAIPESTGALPAAPEANAAAEPPAPAPAPEEMAAAAPPPSAPPPAEDALPPAPEQMAAAEPPTSDDRGIMPDTAPIAPLRPADQPIDVVGEVKPDQVAAAATAAAPGGNWAMQIASQPSEAAAQSSYQDLVRRYGGVLQGKEVNIVKAEIAGKGTFWRVRVPAATRNEAISLCENYKSAGGNCFVSR